MLDWASSLNLKPSGGEGLLFQVISEEQREKAIVSTTTTKKELVLLRPDQSPLFSNLF